MLHLSSDICATGRPRGWPKRGPRAQPLQDRPLVPLQTQEHRFFEKGKGVLLILYRSSRAHTPHKRQTLKIPYDRIFFTLPI